MKGTGGLVRSVWGAVAVLVLVLFPGCVKSKVTVYVNPDGSGNLVVSRVYGRDVVQGAEWSLSRAEKTEVEDYGGNQAHMRSPMNAVETSRGDGAKPKRERSDPFFDEKALKREVKSYGSTVKFVKARRLDMAGARGFVAVYSFKDINDVFVTPDLNRLYNAIRRIGTEDQQDREDDEDGDGDRRGGQGIEFSFQTGIVSRLKILLPNVTADACGVEDGGDGAKNDGVAEKDRGEGGEMSAADREEAGWLGDGSNSDWFYGDGAQMLYLGVAVVCRGTIVASTASHTDAAIRNRIVLLDLDDTRKRDKQEGVPGNGELYGCSDVRRALNAIMKTPGAIVETNREVVVEFK